MILLKPLLTEKTIRLAQAGQFTFYVGGDSAKGAISRAVEEQFKVNVIKVTTSVLKAGTRKTGSRRIKVIMPAKKKAVLTLKAGQMIEFFKLPEEKVKKKAKVKK